MTEKGPPYVVGYGRPPKATQWKPGQTGNRRGAPKRRVKSLPHEFVLGREVIVTEGGVQQKMMADEAILRQIFSMGMAKGGKHRALALEAMDQPQAEGHLRKRRPVVYSVYPELGQVDKPMRRIGMAHLLDPYRPTAKLVIESWLVQAALARLGDRRFTVGEQEIIVAATRKPHSVQWPDWWEAKPA